MKIKISVIITGEVNWCLAYSTIQQKAIQADVQSCHTDALTGEPWMSLLEGFYLTIEYPVFSVLWEIRGFL